MIKLVAFDWNGTILADGAASVRANNKYFHLLKLKPLTLRRYQETFDIPVVNYWLKMGLSRAVYNKKIHEMEEIYHHYYEKYADRCRSRAGVRQALRWLKKQKIDAIIYSNHIVPQIKRHFPRLGFDHLLSHVIARQPGDYSQRVSRGKTEKLHAYVRSRRFRPSEVVTVGDTEEEIEIGKKFGYHPVALTGGWNTTARLRRHRPDFLIHNMAELIPVIKKLNKFSLSH